MGDSTDPARQGVTAPAPQPPLNRAQGLALERLREAGRPMTAYALLDALRPDIPRVAPPTVYRALARLTELGLVHRLETINAYVACDHDHGAESGEAVIFAICGDCGTVRELHDERVNRRMERLVSEQNFTPEAAIIEMRGTCGDCASDSPARGS